jgi:nucleotide-binding universal stress UspA family protein
MTMYQRILVFIDTDARSRRAVEEAVALAGRSGADIVFTTVLPPYPMPAPEVPLSVTLSPEEFTRQAIDDAKRRLGSAVAVAAQAGVHSTSDIGRGPGEVDSLLEAARAHGCGLIVVSSSGHNAVMRLLSGSVIPGLITRSPVPVLIVPPVDEQASAQPPQGGVADRPRRSPATRGCAVLVAASAASAAALAADIGVLESTDPAKAAAIEQKARDIRERAERDAALGRAPLQVGLLRETTPSGVALLSGGITVGDRVAMHAERDRYSLWIATVAKPSGAYLSDARLRLLDAKSRAVVLELVMQGPWLMANLRPGRYELEATYTAEGAPQPQTLRSVVNVPAKGLRQAVFRFDSPAQVNPEMDRPFGGNPFGEPARP